MTPRAPSASARANAAPTRSSTIVTAPSGTVEAFLCERAALLVRATPGLAAARELSDLTDKAVSASAETALSALRKPWVVVALGGYGARRLHPGSDLDLLVVTDAPADELSAPSRASSTLWTRAACSAATTASGSDCSERSQQRRASTSARCFATSGPRTLIPVRSLICMSDVPVVSATLEP